MNEKCGEIINIQHDKKECGVLIQTELLPINKSLTEN